MQSKKMSRRILLSMPEQMMKRLEEEKQKYAYSSTQEIILYSLREKFYFGPEKSAKPARSVKLKEDKILARKKIFSKRGEPIPI